jgi:choline dehydrogenase
MTGYDVIVVGAGAAGAPLAARLTTDPARRVLLVEAGPDCPLATDFPADLLDAGRLTGAMPGHANNWSFSANLTGELRYCVARGRILGGSTTLNGASQVRARRADFDRWAAAGNPEWTYEKALPFYLRQETDLTYGPSALHGGSGPVPVYRELRDPHPVTATFYEACAELGYPFEPDKNDQGEPGYGPLPVNVVDGVRINTGIAYINPHRDRPNLTVRGSTLARRIVFDGTRATGLEVETDGVVEVIGAGEIVLCAGAVKSPHLLALSGIGPADELTAAGIGVICDLPGVGKEFSDHPDITLTWRPRRPLDLPGGRCLFQAALNFTVDGLGDLEILPAAGSLAAAFGSGPADMFFTIVAQQADSRGTTTTVSADPHVQPVIDYDYLRTEPDQRRMRELIRAAAAILGSRAFRPLFAGLGELPRDTLADDRALDAWTRSHLATAIHACGSCAMGPPGDPMAVTDSCGRVHGVSGVRVADTSILPLVPSRGPAATAVMIGERVAHFMSGAQMGHD